MLTVSFTIPGRPYSKKRPRFSRKIGRAFNPRENEVAEASIGAIAAQHFAQPITGPVRVEIISTFAIPKRWSKKKAAAHVFRPHVQKPDCDNLGKAVLDGLNRIAWADDS